MRSVDAAGILAAGLGCRIGRSGELVVVRVVHVIELFGGCLGTPTRARITTGDHVGTVGGELAGIHTLVLDQAAGGRFGLLVRLWLLIGRRHP